MIASPLLKLLEPLPSPTFDLCQEIIDHTVRSLHPWLPSCIPFLNQCLSHNSSPRFPFSAIPVASARLVCGVSSFAIFLIASQQNIPPHSLDDSPNNSEREVCEVCFRCDRPGSHLANASVPSDLPRLQMRTVGASVDVGNHRVCCPPWCRGPCSDVLLTLSGN